VAQKTAPDDLVQELELLGISADSYDYTPLGGVRRVIARRMTESARDVPHYALQMRIILDPLIDLRARINDGAQVKISINDLLIKACALSLTESPGVNVSFTSRGIIQHHHADVAFAVAIEDGLVTPIVRAAEAKSVRDIAVEARDLAARARARRLAPQEFIGGTFTISNLGMYDISSFGSIINQPQACILSVGAAERAFVFRGDEPVAATVMNVTLTCDHRAVDGTVGAQWLGFFRKLLENPEPLDDLEVKSERQEDTHA